MTWQLRRVTIRSIVRAVAQPVVPATHPQEPSYMFRQVSGGHLCRAIALAGLVLGSATVMSTAFAGECPADKAKANVREPVDFKPTGVTDTVLATIDLSKEPIKADGRMQ